MPVHNSFVETLDLAYDNRLGALRPDRHLEPAGERRAGGEKPAPRAIAGHVRAAVNAGSLVSFVSGLSEADMSDVLYSTQLAQRAASAKHDRFAATRDWYHLYAEVLGRVGWVGEGFVFTKRGKAAGTFTLDRSALDVIMTIASGNQLAILVKTLDTLKKLADKSGALRVFEIQALSELSGNFQIGAAQRAENGAVALALGAFYFQSADNRGRALFISWGGEEIDFWTGAQKMTLNKDFYAQHRAAVVARLAADAPDYIAELEIV